MTTMRVVGECFFWYRLTRVFPDKFHRAVKRLCIKIKQSSAMTEYNTVNNSHGLVISLTFPFLPVNPWPPWVLELDTLSWTPFLQHLKCMYSYLMHFSSSPCYWYWCLQCFDTVGWAAGCKKTEWWDAGVVVFGSRFRFAHGQGLLMPAPFTISCSSKSRLVLPFWWSWTESKRDLKWLCVCVCYW